jgi:hypothetical protein
LSFASLGDELLDFDENLPAGSRVLPSGSVVHIKPLGILCMIDDGEADWKVRWGEQRRNGPFILAAAPRIFSMAGFCCFLLFIREPATRRLTAVVAMLRLCIQVIAIASGDAMFDKLHDIGDVEKWMPGKVGSVTISALSPLAIVQLRFCLAIPNTVLRNDGLLPSNRKMLLSEARPFAWYPFLRIVF